MSFRNFFIFLTLVVVCNLALAQPPKSGWKNVSAILKNIVPPKFLDVTYSINDYGAVADGKTDCLPAIKKAIDKCNRKGGGKVIVPPGTFFVKGPIHLKSHINLVVSEGATLKFSPDAEDYLPVVLTRWEGTECYNYSPLIYAYGVTDVAITGTGTIDGNSKNTFATWKKDQKKDQDLIRKMGNDQVPVNERVFGPGHKLRPGMIQFYSCNNILVDGIKIIDAPFWVIHPVLSNNITVRNVKVDSYNYNNDGCDPENSVNVLIENCSFQTGDDAVAIKAGRDQDGWRVGQATENVIIRNCEMNTHANGLCIGSEMSGGVRNVYMENCRIGDVYSAIYFKSNLDRGGFIENVWVKNIEVKKASSRLIAFETTYQGYRGMNFPPEFRNFNIKNIRCEYGGKYAIFAEGVATSTLKNIFIKDVTVTKAMNPYYVIFAENFKLDNVKVNGELLPNPPLSTKQKVDAIPQ